MPITLVLHDPDLGGSEGETAFFDAIFEIAPTHWRVRPDTTLIGTDLSPAYLRDHLRRALDRAGVPLGLLLVTPMDADAAWHGLPPEGEAWIASEAD